MKNLVVREDGTFLVKNVRLSYPHLWKPWAKNPEKEVPKFGAVLILPKDTHREEIKHLIKHAQEMAVGTLKSKVPTDKLFIRNGDDQMKDEYEGAFTISARETRRPTVIDRDKSPLVEEDGKPYGGCYVHALIRPWVQNNEHGKRVNAGLSAIQFYKDGEAFSAAAPVDVDDVFDDEDDLDDGLDDDLDDARKSAAGDPDLDEDIPF